MFANLTIRTKIMVGFGILLALIVIGAATSSNNFLTTQSRIADYRAIAKASKTLILAEESLFHTRMAAKDFLLSPSDEEVDKVNALARETLAYAEATLQGNINEEQAEKLQYITTELKNYQSFFTQVSDLEAQRNDVIRDKIDVFGPDMRNNLERLMRSAYEDGDREAAYYAGLAQTSLMLMRKYAERYMLDNKPDSFTRTINESESLDSRLADMLSRLENPARRDLADQIRRSKESYMAAFAQAYDIIVSRNTIITEKTGPDRPADRTAYR